MCSGEEACDYYDVTFLAVNSKGRIDLQELKDAISEDTALVSIMYANNETGVIFPIEEIVQIVKGYDIPFHCDAVQAVGKIRIDMQENGIDLLAISGHKLHAPKGIGALYIRKGTKYKPFLIGGHQEQGRRGGTENVPYIIGFGKAAELAKKHIDDEQNIVKKLRDKLERSLMATIPDVKLNGDSEHRLPNTSNLSFKFVEGEAILLMLDEYNIAASSGSACTSGALEPSHVLRAMGIPYTFAHGSIRFSLSRYNTDAEIDFVIEKFPQIIERLRSISPYWNG